jgi:hypothetical protein
VSLTPSFLQVIGIFQTDLRRKRRKEVFSKKIPQRSEKKRKEEEDLEAICQ